MAPLNAQKPERTLNTAGTGLKKIAPLELFHRLVPMRIDGDIFIVYSRWMSNEEAVAALAALAHPTRLATFRMLIQHEPEGLATGRLVEATGLTQSTFSTHLAVLVKAGVVRSEKRGRNFIQRADIDALRALMIFLAKDCCQGRADLCEPLLAELACC